MLKHNKYNNVPFDVLQNRAKLVEMCAFPNDGEIMEQILFYAHCVLFIFCTLFLSSFVYLIYLLNFSGKCTEKTASKFKF